MTTLNGKPQFYTLLWLLIILSWTVIIILIEETYPSYPKTSDKRQQSLEWSPVNTDTGVNRSAGVGDGFLRLAKKKDGEEDWGKKICPITELTDLEDFYRYLASESSDVCQNLVTVGGRRRRRRKSDVVDGAKWVCLSNRYHNITPGNCLVYSFGISNDYTFEDAVDKTYKCKVYGFDPTIRWKTHDRSPNFRFVHLGLSNSTNLKPPGMLVDRYVNILQETGHLNSVIDYLKMDVEGYEMRFFHDVFTYYPNLLKNIKQISMEIHAWEPELNDIKKALWGYFQKLECLGFRMIKSEMNNHRLSIMEVNGIIRSCCYEIVWVQQRQL